MAKGQISIVISLLIVFLLIMSILYFVTSRNAIMEPVFIGVRNPIWTRLDNDLKQLGVNALSEASQENNETIAYVIIYNWADIFTSYIHDMFVTVNNVETTLSSDIYLNSPGYSHALLKMDVAIADIYGNNVDYYITINAEINNFVLEETIGNYTYYNLTATVTVNNQVYYVPVETDDIRVLNVTYYGNGLNELLVNGTITCIDPLNLELMGINVTACPR